MFIYLAAPSLSCSVNALVAACKLLVAACGILVPQPRIEPTPRALEAQSPNHWTAREVSEIEKF